VRGIRILTLNLWGVHGDWSARRRVLVDGLRNIAPDLITFQEAVKTVEYDQVTDLLEQGYHVHHQGGRSADGVGTAIASRWPIRSVNEEQLDVTERFDPTARWIGSVAAGVVDCPAPVGSLMLVHHKPAWQLGYERERELQAVATSQFVERTRGDERHVVLAGDFDATPDSGSMRFWTGRQSLNGASICYADAWEATRPGEAGHTFSPRNPLVVSGEMPLERGRRIDYILVRCGEHGPTLDVSRCSLAFDFPVAGVWASDHFGVVADLSAPE